MAEIIGRPGRTASEGSFERFRREGLTVLILIFTAGLILGHTVPPNFWPARPSISLPAFLLFLVAVVIFAYRTDRTMAKYEKERMNWRKGADGEALVSDILCSLPDDFVVVNDIAKRFGNIDHVVIGPTGIYVINTKNWRGTVTLGSNSELLWNGKPTDKPEVHNLARAVMDFHEKVKALCETDYFVRGLMVFTGAYEDVNFASTKPIHCLREDRVVDYIKNPRFAGRLKPEDVKRIKRAVLGLAQMDEQFANS